MSGWILNNKPKRSRKPKQKKERFKLPPLPTIRLGPDQPQPYLFAINPKPKGRHRDIVNVSASGKTTKIHYTPPDTREYESTIRGAAAMQHPLSEPYSTHLTLWCNLRVPDERTGDVDNLIKSIMDGMQQVAYRNDKQIKALHVEMFFEKGEQPLVEIYLVKRTLLQRWADRWKNMLDALLKLTDAIQDRPRQEEHSAFIPNSVDMLRCAACGEPFDFLAPGADLVD